jgi:predicted nucleotidyltransferase
MHEISPEQMAEYKRGARRRLAEQKQREAERRARALEVAREAARLLYDDFGVTRVILFGSLAHGAWFHARSDIDLAVEGLAPEHYWKAWVAIEKLEPSIEVDLVLLEDAKPSVREVVEKEGISL